jgi:hypothetical protein
MLKEILRKLLALFRPGNNRAVRIQFCAAITSDGTTIIGDLTMAILIATKQLPLAIKPLDKKGNPAQIDGVPVWESSNPAAVSLEVATDGLSCTAKAGAIGTAIITAKADADLGAGTKDIIGIYEISVVAGEAATIEIVAGEPVEQA